MITALRERAGVTQSHLAVTLGVSPSAVSQVEQGHAIQEVVFARYTAALGFADELDALEAGVAALRGKPAPAKPAGAPVKAKARPRAKAPATPTTAARKPPPRQKRVAARA